MTDLVITRQFWDIWTSSNISARVWKQNQLKEKFLRSCVLDCVSDKNTLNNFWTKILISYTELDLPVKKRAQIEIGKIIFELLLQKIFYSW